MCACERKHKKHYRENRDCLINTAGIYGSMALLLKSRLSPAELIHLTNVMEEHIH